MRLYTASSAGVAATYERSSHSRAHGHVAETCRITPFAEPLWQNHAWHLPSRSRDLVSPRPPARLPIAICPAARELGLAAAYKPEPTLAYAARGAAVLVRAANGPVGHVEVAPGDAAAGGAGGGGGVARGGAVGDSHRHRVHPRVRALRGDTVSGNFVVVDHDIFWSSDHPGIDLTVTSPDGNTVYSLKGKSGDKFEFKAPRGGMYKFCFHNPYGAPETVSFYIHVGHIPNEHNLAKDEHLDPINVKIAELKEALESVTAEQKYLKAREARHRHTNESTRKRVMFYTIAEYLAFMAASALQVVYIRRLFSKNVAYNRV
ncbi:hypothetical protein GUJ93_ZPchr0139g33500 [Zizania palustris]|uniref:GOLD domain-containing protein n=1 Tax=Zizania palustris TaxID=103762 RepID=A0A8J5R2S7_ZIZPA|nr:hypothetical protein GUJ93_ZPchr0139g33500 [Zizania palustris]